MIKEHITKTDKHDNHINILCTDINIDASLIHQRQNERWIGVDRGAEVLLSYDITPTYMVGDFDSVDCGVKSELIEQGATILPEDKDLTDLDQALRWCDKNKFTSVNVYGATGGRLDHFMSAIELLKHPKRLEEKHSIRMIDDQNVLQMFDQGKHHIANHFDMKYVSFIQQSDICTIAIEGFKYNLEKTTLKQGESLTVSNEFLKEKGVLHVYEGLVLVIQSKDK